MLRMCLVNIYTQTTWKGPRSLRCEKLHNSGPAPGRQLGLIKILVSAQITENKWSWRKLDPSEIPMCQEIITRRMKEPLAKISTSLKD